MSLRVVEPSSDYQDYEDLHDFGSRLRCDEIYMLIIVGSPLRVSNPVNLVNPVNHNKVLRRSQSSGSNPVNPVEYELMAEELNSYDYPLRTRRAGRQHG